MKKERLKTLIGEPEKVAGEDTELYNIPINAKELVSGLFVCQERTDIFLTFCFLQENSCDIQGKNKKGTILLHGEALVGNLKELRHTWWGEDQDGYLYYPNIKYIKAAMAWLELWEFEE
jgi:hypothetical protein